MKVFGGMDPRLALVEVARHARRVEALGLDGLHVPETVHDSLAVALLAAEHTRRITVRTSVTLAFVRSPTLVAYAAWDLAKLSGGRFELGVGTQIRQNIEERYGATWSDPVGRMRDYLAALRALFASFATSEPLDHHGPHYRLTRLQPYFNPGPEPEVTPPPVWLGGVGPAMCHLAGELADGLVTHPTNSSPRYLTEVALPAVRAGAEAARRDPGATRVVAGIPIATGATGAEVATERERQRRLMGFLLSTPAYRPTLALHGWDDLPGRLRAATRAGRWDDLGRLVGDEVLDALVVSARHDELAAAVAGRFGQLVDGVVLTLPADRSGDPALARVVAELQAVGPSS